MREAWRVGTEARCSFFLWKVVKDRGRLRAHGMVVVVGKGASVGSKLLGCCEVVEMVEEVRESPQAQVQFDTDFCSVVGSVGKLGQKC